ncbi:MAG: IS1634 family transposase [Chitinophagaceae bacterium]
MFVRKKKNKSGVVSIQIIEKRDGKSVLLKTIGSSADPKEIQTLFEQGKAYVLQFGGQQVFQFEDEQQIVDAHFKALQSFRLVGPELLLGKIFDDIGFHQIKDELFRHLVITRLIFPVSKLKTADYLYRFNNEEIDVERIYRYLDKLYTQQKQIIEHISYAHTLQILGGKISIMFYDVTTLYFESEREDALRKTGFSKEGKHQNPQIVLGLLVSKGGYPLTYEIFEGKQYEGHTLLPVVEGFKARYKLEELVVIADAGLLSNDNIRLLQSKGYQYIIGARIKNETSQIQQKILANKPGNGQNICLHKDEYTRLIVSYSTARATKDAANRKRGLEKLEKQIASGKLTKANINNRGYNKYLCLTGDVTITINKQKYEQDAVWDGLKGYITNTTLKTDQIIDNYRELWQIEKAFRISKTDLQIRPVYHRLQRRIEAHICIAFCAYKVYKELERQLKIKKAEWSVEKAIEITKTIYSVTIKTHLSDNLHTRLYIQKPEQQLLLNLFNINFG